ncbi:MAG TPA: hypothetical protein VFH84_06870 [Amycolatopsis sp.]|nr:hypothetical protein [Amycolatopsis sp.]HET6704677.1 hypothetical protein [Amycolatopsis sp.]
MRVVVFGEHVRVEDRQPVDPARRRRTRRQLQRAARHRLERDVAAEVAELVVPDAGGVDEPSGRRFVPGPSLVVGVGRAGAEDEVAARAGVGGQSTMLSAAR